MLNRNIVSSSRQAPHRTFRAPLSRHARCPKRNAVPGTPPGPPVQWDKAEDPDDVQPTPPTTRTSSTTTPTTSALHPTSPTPRPTSPSSMPTCLMANYSWTNTAVARKCRISSTARNSTRRQDCIIMARDT